MQLPLRAKLLWVCSLLVWGAGLSAGCFGSTDAGRTGGEGNEGGDVIDLDNVPTTPEACRVNPTRDPGRVVMHRLNRTEYDNTVRDLLGDTTAPARQFPADDYGYGFDNIATVLSMAPLLVEKYDEAAQKLVDEAWARESGPGQTIRVQAESGATATVGAASGTVWNLFSNGSLTAPMGVQTAGTYRLSVRAYASQAGTESAKMAFLVNGTARSQVDVAATSAAPQTYTFDLSLPVGTHIIGASFLNDFTDSAAGTDRNLFVDWFDLSGTGTKVDPAQARVRICDPVTSGEASCAREMIGSFARRAWRRPVQTEELERLVSFVTLAQSQGDDWAQGVRLAMHAALLSPHFLFRVELDPDPSAPVAHPLNDHELAARLSYFLWSSMPDAELMANAEAGLLQDDAVLEAQVARMLADARSSALVESFAGQWLYTRAVPELTPDATQFPGFDAPLKTAMKAETELLFRAFVDEDRSFLDILSADFTFLNDRLAAHYGLPEPGTGATMKRVPLTGQSTRSGLLTHGSILTVTSQPNRTSPVKRGKWVLAQLLCAEPPPPPPNVEADLGAVVGGTTTREKLEEHRANPACAACHSSMDPIGLGMENFDAVGTYRTTEAGKPIDPSGALPDGKCFSSVAELSSILKADPRLSHCVTEKLFTYALGKGDLQNQACYLHETVERFSQGGFRLRELITTLTQSGAFRQRRGEEGT